MRIPTSNVGSAPNRRNAVCPENEAIADGLDELAELLDLKGANPFRVRAYHLGGDLVRRLNQPVCEILRRGGRAALLQLPGIGDSLSISIARLAATGELPLLKRLRGRAGSEAILRTVPGIGSKTAALIRQQLGIQTLADLEIAAHDGRLASVPGLGHKRLRAVQDSLAGRLGNRRSVVPADDTPAAVRPRPMGKLSDNSAVVTRRVDQKQPEQINPRTTAPGSQSSGSPGTSGNSALVQSVANQPAIAELLSIDTEFRQKERAGRLPRIAPLRFNPEGEAWLPILHTSRDDRKYTALFSNSPLANEQHTTHDWVVIYREGRGAPRQWTVVTERNGKLAGRRVVRGREAECQAHYADVDAREPVLF